MRIQFNPKFLIIPEKTSGEVNVVKLKAEKISTKKSILDIRRRIKEIFNGVANFGGIEMLKGKDDTSEDINQTLDESQKAFLKSGYIKSLRGEPKEIADFRKKLIDQFNSSSSKN